MLTLDPADPYYPFLWIHSPYRAFSSDWNEALFDSVAPLAESIQFDVHPLIEDEDWEMDCQDYHDVEAFLDLTGNLDAPLS